MKTLEKLKIGVVALCMMAGMTSCFKNSDPGFAISPLSAYLVQEGTGANVRFKPAIYLAGNQPIDSATCKFEGKTYYFTPIKETRNYNMELSSWMALPVDTVRNGLCSIVAISATEEPENASIQLNFGDVKVLGEFRPENMKYDGTTNVITAEWADVENAKEYVLMYRTDDVEMWLPFEKFKVSKKDEKNMGTIEFTIQEKQEVYVAIGATNDGSVFVISGKAKLIGGQDSNW